MRARRLEWGADEHEYRGNLTIAPDGDSASTVTVKLTFGEQLQQRLQEQMGSAPAPEPPPIEDGIERALHSIANYVEGHGGKDGAPVARSWRPARRVARPRWGHKPRPGPLGPGRRCRRCRRARYARVAASGWRVVAGWATSAAGAVPRAAL